MSCVQLPTHPSVICISLAGAVHVQHRVEAFEALIELLQRTGCRRVLIDLSHAVLVDGSHAETLEHAARLAQGRVMQKVRIAYVGGSGAATSIQSLASLRGYFYRRFGSREAALRWLCADGVMARAA